MKPVYLHLCKLNKIREDFLNDFYKALRGSKRVSLPDIYEVKPEDLKLSAEETALLYKVHSMVYGGDLATVLRMLYSFRFGAKRIKSNPYGSYTDSMYEYTDKDGNEKLSHKGNLPRAHFRWNFGKRYTLNADTLQKIETFLGAIFPPDINYTTRKK